jgi:sulfopyruvate decarboxylase subunit alpha
MREESIKEAIAGLKESGINFVAGLPDGWLWPLLLGIKDDSYFQYIDISNEGTGLAICVGAWLGGKLPALIMENSGIRVAAEQIARLCMDSRIPVLLIMTDRGGFGETEYWAIGHGLTLEPILNAFKIPFARAHTPEELKKRIIQAVNTMNASCYPVAVIIGTEIGSEVS